MSDSTTRRDAPVAERADAREGDSLWYLAEILLRSPWLVFRLPLLAALAMAVLSATRPRTYEATSAFVLSDVSGLAAGFAQLAGQLGFAGGRSGFATPQFYADMLRSRDFLRDVAATPYGPGDSARPGRTLIDRWTDGPGTTPADTERVVRQLRGASFVRLNRNTSVIQVRVRLRDRALAELVAQRFVTLTDELTNQWRQQRSGAERAFVQSRLAAARSQLRDAEGALADFYRRNRRFQDSPELVAQQARLEREVVLQQQVYVTLVQLFENARMEELRNTPALVAVQYPLGASVPRSKGVVRRSVLVFVALAALGAFVILLDDAWERASGEIQAAGRLRRRVYGLAGRVRGLAPLRRR